MKKFLILNLFCVLHLYGMGQKTTCEEGFMSIWLSVPTEQLGSDACASLPIAADDNFEGICPDCGWYGDHLDHDSWLCKMPECERHKQRHPYASNTYAERNCVRMLALKAISAKRKS